jgi:hypothetical protein
MFDRSQKLHLILTSKETAAKPQNLKAARGLASFKAAGAGRSCGGSRRQHLRGKQELPAGNADVGARTFPSRVGIRNIVSELVISGIKIMHRRM